MGRSVLPESIEETLGRSITDEELQNNRYHYVRDHIFCFMCEENLSHFESLYSSQRSLVRDFSLKLSGTRLLCVHDGFVTPPP